MPSLVIRIMLGADFPAITNDGRSLREGGGMATVELTLTGVARRLRVQGWTLFWFLAACFVAAELRLASVIDWSNSADIRWLMGINWRLAAPYFLLTFAASPLHQLFPGGATRWLLANRRYIGLAFAVGAFCQLLPIVTLALRFQPALADIHSASSQFGEDCIYLTLVLMTVTSFRATNRHISRTTWRRLHSTGIYLCFLRAVRNRRDVCRAWHRVRCRLGDARGRVVAAACATRRPEVLLGTGGTYERHHARGVVMVRHRERRDTADRACGRDGARLHHVLGLARGRPS